MKLSSFFYTTLRETPSDAQLPSHIFLMRGGYIKPLSTGIYSILPLGLRVIRKIQNIIREEMNAVGGLETDLPVVQTAELWSEAGRYQAIGDELLRFKDRNAHSMVLAMTHEEAITDMARYMLSSYKQLPFMLYQFKTKYRDEARARGGLIRAREFEMKDAYSFHATSEDLDEHYELEYKAYQKIFRRVGIEPIIVQSDTGIMGGKIAHEFMLATPNGEDYLIICEHCGYQANREIAEFKRQSAGASTQACLEKTATPNKKTIEDVCAFLNANTENSGKCVFYDVNGKLIVALVQGNLDISETKLRNHLKCKALIPAAEELIKASGMIPGYASPINAKNCKIVIDTGAAESTDLIVGANEEGYHFKHCVPKRDFADFETADIAEAAENCLCTKCEKPLTETRGIELGNIFKLGTKFSENMGCVFTDANGEVKPAVMGCYGIGVGRLMASVVETSHDDFGPIWPLSIAPFHVLIVQITKDEAVLQVSEQLEKELSEQGIEVLVDDRDERPGVKFKDGDLWGVPIRIAIGKKGLVDGKVEWKLRSQKEMEMVPIAEVAGRVKNKFLH
ncbi:MAG: proline--tRNA ligase [Fibromonadaceae bacterium]|jgi:prolyl-tRNA synthetase|nr:proline--tRNA ligase [Fibromonadaceae bacterium]